MELTIDEVIRRLLLLGLPLIPLACDPAQPLTERPDLGVADASGQGGAAGGSAGPSGAGGCGTIPFSGTFDFARSQFANREETFDGCYYDNDCRPLCSTKVGFLGGYVTMCQRVDGSAPGVADAGTRRDAGAADAGDLTVSVNIAGQNFTCLGRRPAGLVHACAPKRGTAAGRWLAGAAALEGASIPAFQQLVRELQAHGAPAHLVAAARAAVAEEARHYLLTARAARARGATTERVRVRRGPLRPLLDVARDNAREGCVRETFGALTAVHQARHAPEGDVRSAMQVIARDETAHARLAWEIDAWARARLPANDARNVVDARHDEAATLVAEVKRLRPRAALLRELGLPSPRESRALARVASSLLWTA